MNDPDSGFLGHPTFDFQVLSKVTDTVSRLDPAGASVFRFPFTNGIKRKWGVVAGESPLVLGLSPSWSSSVVKENSETCTLSSTKETTDDGSSMDLNLNFHFHIGSDKNANHRKEPYPKTNEDSTSLLRLSLCTVPSESEISSLIPASVHGHGSSEPVVGDDSSTLSWKRDTGSLPIAVVPPYSRRQSFDLNRSLDDADLVRPVSTSSAMTLLSKGSSSCSPELNQSRANAVKTCKFARCRKGARGASGLCIAHGGGRRCQRAGCHKGADGRTAYCKAHGGGRRCEFLGCTKSAEGRTDFCIGHGGGRRCSFSGGCTKAARGKSGLCIRHGGGKRCQMESCTKSAEGLSGLCISHGGGRRCQSLQCTKGAQGSTMFCKAHGGGKRCTFPRCGKGAEGSTLFCKGHGGGKRCTFDGSGGCTRSVHGGTKFCVAHGGGKRCIAVDCTKSARGRTSFCVRHGGGKRCKWEGCGKSAQGSTDFCKAHGGGKRCSWRQHGSLPCDRFARGKMGFCQAHSALVQDRCVHGGGKLNQATMARKEKPKGGTNVDESNQEKHHDASSSSYSVVFPVVSLQLPIEGRSPMATGDGGGVAVPEGRVHGGTLMAMLGGEAIASSGMSNERFSVLPR